MSNEKFKVKFGLAVGDTAATIDGTSGDITTNGDAAINGGDITSTSTVANVFNNAGINTVNIGNGAATEVNVGGTATPRVQVKPDTLVGAQATQNVFNTVATTVNAFGAATTVSIGADVGTTTVNNALVADSITTSGDAAINGGDITTSSLTATVFNATATTLNMGGAATTVSIGANTGTTTVNNSLVADDLSVTGSVTANGVTIGATANQVSTSSSNLTLNTANGTNSGSIVITAGANGNITLTPNGTGDVIASADTLQVGDANATATITTNGTGDLVLNTNSGTNAGNITLSNGTNGNITVTPNGTGNFAVSASNGGNLTNTRNYVFGAIRDSTTQANGDMWSFTSGAGTGYRGVSIDNSVATTKRPATVIRGYGGGLAGGLPRSALLFENSRGSAASPTAVQQFDGLGEVIGTGRTSTGWVTDLVAAVPVAQNYYAAENWVSTTNLGAGWLLRCQPTATTLSATSLISVIDASAQQYAQRSDSWAVSAGKTQAFVATGCSISGTTLTIGTVTSGTVAVGTALQTSTGAWLSTYITANISGSGSGSTWTISQSQTTASGLTVIGYKGAIGYAPGISTVDVLQSLNLINPNSSNINTANQILQVYSAYAPSTGVAPGYKHNGVMGTSGAPTNSGTTFEMASSFKATSGSATYTPPNSGWGVGQFMFSAYGATDGTSQAAAGKIQAVATENWSTSASGSKLVLSALKQGSFFSGVEVASLQPEGSTFKADSYTFKTSTGSDMASISATGIGFPVYTITQAQAITGSVGKQICISNSSGSPSQTDDGMMAYWATNGTPQWRYIHNNGAL
jgi:hypothetical protein